MNTAVINVKVNPLIKMKAREVAEELGFSLSALIKAYLRDLVRTKAVRFSAVSEEPSPYLLKALRESEADRKAGRVISFSSPDKALKYLDKIIKDEDRRTKN